MASSTIELHDNNSVPASGQQTPREMVDDDTASQAPMTEFSLPPADGGKQAWLFLAACWVIEAVTFGFGFSFGVFQEYYNHHEPFQGSGSIAAVGTTCTGLLYIASPFIVAICRLYPQYARWFTPAGLLVASLALALSSFCKTVPQLLFTQGIMFGVGGCSAYCPCTIWISDWFVRRRGFAYGIVWSAAGAGGAILPLLIQTLLNKYGLATAMRICAGILFLSSAPLAFLIRPRLPYSAVTRTRPFDMRFLKSKTFALHQLVNIIEATGYFLPAIYLPTYASTTFGTSNFLSTLTVILVNIAATVGLIVMGLLSDRLSVTNCMIISASGVGTSVLLIWGLTASLPVLYLFCVLYGLFAGSWASIWPGIMREVTQRGESEGYGQADPIMVHGHLCAGRGIGNIISGPLSDSLIKGMPWQGSAIGGYGSGFGVLILYTGLTGLFSGSNFVWKRLGLL